MNTTAEVDAAFRARYGPWAVIAGASEGVGESLAHKLAARGLKLVLLARRQTVLDEVADSIRAETDVEVRAVSLDLSEDDAMQAIGSVTKGLQVGFVAYCAGADPNYQHFLDNPVEIAVAMIRRNCELPVRMCHHFGGAMAARGRGALVVYGSGAGLVGAPNMVAYSSTKAFDMVLGEALWAELHSKGVDVMCPILALTDTPALRRLMAARGQLASADDDSPIEGAISAEDTAQETLDNLQNGPTWMVGDMLRDGAQQLSSLPRNDAVKLMIELESSTMGSAAEATS